MDKNDFAYMIAKCFKDGLFKIDIICRENNNQIETFLTVVVAGEMVCTQKRVERRG